MFCILGLLILIAQVPFYSFLGAGLGKRPQKPLGAHQLGLGDRSEREQGCYRFTDQIMFSVLEIRHS